MLEQLIRRHESEKEKATVLHKETLKVIRGKLRAIDFLLRKKKQKLAEESIKSLVEYIKNTAFDKPAFNLFQDLLYDTLIALVKLHPNNMIENNKPVGPISKSPVDNDDRIYSLDGCCWNIHSLASYIRSHRPFAEYERGAYTRDDTRYLNPRTGKLFHKKDIARIQAMANSKGISLEFQDPRQPAPTTIDDELHAAIYEIPDEDVPHVLSDIRTVFATTYTEESDDNTQAQHPLITEIRPAVMNNNVFGDNAIDIPDLMRSQQQRDSDLSSLSDDRGFTNYNFFRSIGPGLIALASLELNLFSAAPDETSVSDEQHDDEETNTDSQEDNDDTQALSSTEISRPVVTDDNIFGENAVGFADLMRNLQQGDSDLSSPSDDRGSTIYNTDDDIFSADGPGLIDLPALQPSLFSAVPDETPVSDRQHNAEESSSSIWALCCAAADKASQVGRGCVEVTKDTLTNPLTLMMVGGSLLRVAMGSGSSSPTLDSGEGFNDNGNSTYNDYSFMMIFLVVTHLLHSIIDFSSTLTSNDNYRSMQP